MFKKLSSLAAILTASLFLASPALALSGSISTANTNCVVKQNTFSSSADVYANFKSIPSGNYLVRVLNNNAKQVVAMGNLTLSNSSPRCYQLSAITENPLGGTSTGFDNPDYYTLQVTLSGTAYSGPGLKQTSFRIN